jgi:rod shape-determining protein MreC
MRVIWWLAIVVTISLISILLSHYRALDPLQNLSLTVSAPLQGSLRDLASPINDFFQGIVDRGRIARENERLREENERLKAELASGQDAAQRVRELEDALGVKQTRPEDQILAANVIGQEISGLKRAIAIDRGLSDGVDEGMVVLSKNGALVGTVSRAYQDFAWVRLVTDPDSTVNAQVTALASTPTPAPAPDLTATPAPQEPPTQAPVGPEGTTGPESSPIRGVAEGDLRRGLVLDLLPPDASVQPGGLVTTSGLGGNYPRGILIATVKSVEERPQSPFKKATLEPAANLSALDTVLVIISFRPARLSAP